MKESQQIGPDKGRMSEFLPQKIKMRAHNELIGKVVYFYSILKKRNNSSTSYNQRFLLLKGSESIGYARSPPANTVLPFKSISNLPRLKKETKLLAVKNVLLKESSLIIEFVSEIKQLKWQFQCGSKDCALQWQAIIKNAVQEAILIKSDEAQKVNAFQNHHISPNNQNQSNQFLPLPNPHNISNENQRQNNSNRLPVYPNSINNNINESTISQQPSYNHQEPVYLTNNNHHQFPYQIFSTTLTPNIQSSSNANMELGQSNLIINNKVNALHPLSFVNEPFLIPQNQLKNGLATSSNGNTAQINTAVGMRIKEQYLRKKEQQQKRRVELYESESVRINLLTESQAQEAEQRIIGSNWDYEFLKGQNEYIIVQRFKVFCEQIIFIIINQLGLQQRKRRFKPTKQTSTYYQYEVERITFHLALLQLHQTSFMQDRTTIISNQQVKNLNNQFKNSNYILQITKNKGRFRLPLMMLIEYKGFTVLCKALVHSSNDFSGIEHLLQQDIKQLERDTKISRTIFQDDDNIRALSADQKMFEKLSRSQNKFKKFDNCFLTDIRHYLPQDFYGYSKQSSSCHKLRAQLLQGEQYEDLLLNGSNLNLVLSRVRVPTQTRDAINILSNIAKTIPDRAVYLIQSIQNLDAVITNSQQLSSLMHSNGINMRYLGLVYDNAKQTWLKRIVLSQIAARSAKYFLQYDLQDSLIHLNATSLQEAKEYQIGQVLGWLNRIFGIGPESDSIWRQIFRQAQYYFKCSVNRQNIHLGFLLQALQHHGKFHLQNLTFREPFFKTNSIFSRNHFNKFFIASKCYDLDFTQHYSLINAKIDNLNIQSFEQVSSILNLDKRQSLDSHFAINNRHQAIILFLTNWLSPQKAPFIYSLNYEGLPNKLLYQLQITAIKWQLKDGRVSEAEKIRDSLIEHVNKWLGQSYPILTQLYEIFARFYLNYRQEEKSAISYCKSMLRNQEKLLGAQHAKLADTYYQLADIYLNYGKKVQALQSYKKALQILEDNNAHETEACIEITIKVSQMYLANSAVQEALRSASKSFELSKSLMQNELYLLSAQLIGRCYELNHNWIDYMKFIDQISSAIHIYKQNPHHLQRILKVILSPILHNIAIKSRQSSKTIRSVINQFQQRNGLKQASYQFLKSKIEEKSFPQTFFSFLDNVESILVEIETSGLMNRWKGFESMGTGNRFGSRAGQMVSYLQSLHRLLSGNFIQGIFDGDQQ